MSFQTKWLFGKTCCNEEKGISETLTATGQSGLAATRLLGRSGASLQDSSDDEELEIAMRPQASCEWLAEDQNTAMSHRRKEKRGNLPGGNRATGGRSDLHYRWWKATFPKDSAST
jgi:hypothetical protein